MSQLQDWGLDPSVPSTTMYSADQKQTEETFSYKWSRRDSYESPEFKRKVKGWLVGRYCDGNESNLDKWLGGNKEKIILDAGCGSGFSALLLFGDYLKKHKYIGVDISNAVFIAKKRFEEARIPGEFLKSDLLNMPIPDESVDMIYSDGVFHHTDSTKEAICRASQKLKKGGHILFYVYAKKSVIREFTDDFIREKIKDLSEQEAWEQLVPLTRLGKSLGDLDIEVEVAEDVELLGIKKGKHNLQRLFYWNIFKAYYDKNFSLDEMNHINFDWFRPQNCHRHTAEEVRSYCVDAGINIEVMKSEKAGFTVIGVKS